MNVALHPDIIGRPDALRYISLCTGGGGLDLGLELAIPSARPVCLVEREAFSVAHLVAAMQAGLMAPAPVWSDVSTFNGRPWRGLVDGLIGGIPCQPHSQAGKRQGSADERDLWSDARRIIAQARPWFVLIENVAGMLTAGADEIAGAQRVRGDLHRLGYAVEGGLFSAAEVGAPHERKRLFILALADAGYTKPPKRQELAQSNQGCMGPWRSERSQPPSRSGNELADRVGFGQRREGCPRQQKARPYRGGGELGDANSARRTQARAGSIEPAGAQPQARSGKLGDTTRERCGEGRPKPGLWSGRDTASSDGQPMGDATGLQRQEIQRDEPDRDCVRLGDATGQRGGRLSDRQERKQDSDLGRSIPLFPPGPSDTDAWARIARTHPHLEPAVCKLAHGLAAGVDNTRVDELRMLGNGVVPLVAGHAIRSLLAAHKAAGTLQAGEFV